MRAGDETGDGGARLRRWQCRDRTVVLDRRTGPLIMGIVNVTPDSFSDGGRFLAHDRAVAHGLRLVEEGADMLDVGGESTRPGAAAVDAEVESARVVPVIEELARTTDVLLSVDTSKAAVARRAIEVGARVINDVTALTGDPGMGDLARETGAGVVLMHMSGTPRTMQAAPHYEDVVAEVGGYLAARVIELMDRGLIGETLALDPGIGFGKTVAHNVELLANVDVLAAGGHPVVVGVSRKSFLCALTGRPVDERLPASLGALAFLIRAGADVVRVHDVRETRDVVAVVTALEQGRRKGNGLRLDQVAGSV